MQCGITKNMSTQFYYSSSFWKLGKEAVRVCVNVGERYPSQCWLLKIHLVVKKKKKDEGTSAAEKKESSEVIVVASSSRRLRTLSTWGKIRVPSLSVKSSKKSVIVGVEISQVMKEMNNCWQKNSMENLCVYFLDRATYESLIRPIPKSANTLSVGMLLPKSSCRWYALCSSDSSFSANILLRDST